MMTELKPLSRKNASVAKAATVRIAVCGEFSAGKSTVINALLGENLLPNVSGKGHRPEIVLKSGADASITATGAKGVGRRSGS